MPLAPPTPQVSPRLLREFQLVCYGANELALRESGRLRLGTRALRACGCRAGTRESNAQSRVSRGLNLCNDAQDRKRPVNCPMDRGMREDPGSVRVQEAASGSPVRVGFQFAGASSAISVMFMSGNLLRTSVR